MFLFFISADDIYLGLCNWEPNGFVYMSSVCMIHNGKVVMLDWCRYGKGYGSDDHIQDGYYVEVYRKSRSAYADKRLVREVYVKTPSNVERRKYIDSNFYCTGVKDDENAAYYDVQLEGNLSASAMKFCREWCNNKQSSRSVGL